MKGRLIWIAFLILGRLEAQDTIILPLAGTEIKMLKFGEVHSDVLLYNMHDNENTSALAGRMMVRKYRGTYFELMHTGKRQISFAWNQDSIHIDPNRIYTEQGIWQQLLLNKKPDTLALKVIKAWSDSLLTMLDIHKRSLVIALHNNTNKNYSFKSYLPDGPYARDAYLLFTGCVRDEDHFYFTTSIDIFDQLTIGRYHVILQDNQYATNDGSLSVYCGQLGIPYVNVESQHGAFWRQLKMLMFVYQQLISPIEESPD